MKRTDLAMLLAGGAALGAGAMYLLDPQRGRRRRALLRDKTVRVLHLVQHAAGKTERDLLERIHGATAEFTGAFAPELEVDDPVLAARVRAIMGRVVGHPGAIEVTAEKGCVLLRGLILEDEFEPLLAAISHVKGVREVRSWLRPRQDGAHTSALQGGVRRTRNFFQRFEGRWSPALRLLTGAGGVALVAYGARRRDFPGVIASAIGAGAITRALTNVDPAHLLGLDEAFAIHIQKTLNVAAPLADLYQFWADPRNYPRAFAHVREVTKVADNLYHWSVTGPAGLEFGWDGTIVEARTNELLVWKSVSGSLVGNEGMVRFDPNYDGTTRLHVRMSYYPPAGLLGHLIAEIFGADPRRVLDEDLGRLRAILEHGKGKVHGKPVTAADLGVKTAATPVNEWQGVAT
jgi:uncharacterized membrane protein